LHTRWGGYGMWNMLESLARQLRAVCVSYHRCDPQASEGAGGHH
jgi:hypothetical protein